MSFVPLSHSSFSLIYFQLSTLSAQFSSLLVLQPQHTELSVFSLFLDTWHSSEMWLVIMWNEIRKTLGRFHDQTTHTHTHSFFLMLSTNEMWLVTCYYHIIIHIYNSSLQGTAVFTVPLTLYTLLGHNRGLQWNISLCVCTPGMWRQNAPCMCQINMNQITEVKKATWCKMGKWHLYPVVVEQCFSRISAGIATGFILYVLSNMCTRSVITHLSTLIVFRFSFFPFHCTMIRMI